MKKSSARFACAGIDAPEKGQDFGNASRQHLADGVLQRPLLVDVGKTDRYGRLVGKVPIGGNDVNLSQISAGLAWHYKKYAKEQSPEDRRRYADAEDEARATRRGLWRDTNPEPPWDFRARSRPHREWAVTTREYPENVDEAVRLLLRLLDASTLHAIRESTEDSLIGHHFGTAAYIRSAFGLWAGNQSLLDDTKQSNPDDASLVILAALWRALRATTPPGLQ